MRNALKLIAILAGITMLLSVTASAQDDEGGGGGDGGGGDAVADVSSDVGMGDTGDAATMEDGAAGDDTLAAAEAHGLEPAVEEPNHIVEAQGGKSAEREPQEAAEGYRENSTGSDRTVTSVTSQTSTTYMYDRRPYVADAVVAGVAGARILAETAARRPDTTVIKKTTIINDTDKVRPAAPRTESAAKDAAIAGAKDAARDTAVYTASASKGAANTFSDETPKAGTAKSKSGQNSEISVKKKKPDLSTTDASKADTKSDDTDLVKKQ